MFSNIQRRWFSFLNIDKVRESENISRGPGEVLNHTNVKKYIKINPEDTVCINERRTDIWLVDYCKRKISSRYRRMWEPPFKQQTAQQACSSFSNQAVPPPEEHTSTKATHMKTKIIYQGDTILSECSQAELLSTSGPQPSSTITTYKDESSTVLDLSHQITRTRTDPVFVGNYSLVFIGEWDDRIVAIKVIREIGTAAAMKRKVRREKEVWASLKHEHIVPLYGFCEETVEFGTYGALISPWYRNGHAAHYIQQNSVPANQRFNLWADIIQGMAYLHSHNPVLVHGDLKPMNVLIDDDGHARICDFGLVRILSDESNGLTTTTTHTGTVRYLAHELVVSDQPVPTVASDVHAIGCIGLDLIFLTLPYANRKGHAQVIADIIREIPPATEMPVPAPVKSRAITNLWDTLNLCWNINPEMRLSVRQLQEYVARRGGDIKSALENGFDGSLI